MMNKCRYYLYGDEHDETILKRNKTAWKGREYQNLHKRGRGWSFPMEMKTLIDHHLLSSSEERVKVVVDINTAMDDACEEEVSVQTSTLELDSLLIQNSSTVEVVKNEPRYLWDVPREVYDYFEHLMSSLKETRRMTTM